MFDNELIIMRSFLKEKPTAQYVDSMSDALLHQVVHMGIERSHSLRYIIQEEAFIEAVYRQIGEY